MRYDHTRAGVDAAPGADYTRPSPPTPMRWIPSTSKPSQPNSTPHGPRPKQTASNNRYPCPSTTAYSPARVRNRPAPNGSASRRTGAAGRGWESASGRTTVPSQHRPELFSPCTRSAESTSTPAREGAKHSLAVPLSSCRKARSSGPATNARRVPVS